MADRKKTPNFHILRYIASAPKVACLILLFVLLVPIRRLPEGTTHLIEHLGEAGAEVTQSLLKIYALIKSHRSDLNESDAWAISRAVLEESIKHSLDPLLVLAVINVESGFQHQAVSIKGARGLMQIRPYVADALVKELDLELGAGSGFFRPEFLHDPVLNIKLGVFYLHYLKKNFRDLKLALAAYNWGPTEVKARLEESQPVPLEYSTKVLSTYRRFQKHS